MKLVLYSKPGCHLCEGLEEKINAIEDIEIELEIRNIKTNDDWWEKYKYEIPVLYVHQENQNQLQLIPRFSPRTPVSQLSKILKKYL